MSEVTAASADPAADSPWARLWRRGILVHLAGYLGLLAVLLAVGVMDGSFTSDEGAYYLQVELLEDGRWDLEYPLADTDPDGVYFPIINSDAADGEWFPYVKHPLYVHLLDISIGVLGPGVGGHLWSVLGALGAAAAAWFLAASFDVRLARLSFWLAALGPVLANSQMVWAHTLSAAVGGAAALVVVHIVADRRLTVGRAAGLAALLAVGVLLRTEGLLWAAALLAALGVVVVRHRWWRWLVGLGAVGVVALVAFAGQRAWRLAIVGGSVPSVPDSSADSAGGWVGTRIRAGIDILTKGAEVDPTAAAVLVIAVLFVLLAALSWRAGRPWAEASALVTAATVLYVVRLVAFEPDPIGGILAAWPIVLVALVVARGQLFDRPARTLVLATGVFAVLVVLSQWGEAGGVQWGGRYLSPAIPAVAALSAVALRGRPARAAGAASADDAAVARRWFPTPLLAVLVLVPAVGAAVVPEQMRDLHDELVADATRTGDEVIISGQGSLPRFAWSTQPATQWYLLDDDDDDEGSLAELLDQLAGIDVEQVAVVSVDVEPDELDGWTIVSDDDGVTVLRRTT